MPGRINIIWYRRDLRLDDNAALFHALNGAHPVLPVFVFDKNILDELDERQDRRVMFIHTQLKSIQQELVKFGSTLHVHYGTPLSMFENLATQYDIDTVYANHDYEPYAIDRDRALQKWLSLRNIQFKSYKDQVIFEKNEVLKDDGKPYTVFTPYSRKWKVNLNDDALKYFDCRKRYKNFIKQPAREIPTLQSMNFVPTDDTFPSKEWDDESMMKYKEDRDLPGRSGTSRLGVHLRFGTISIRKLTRAAMIKSEMFLNELIWREFYQTILFHFPIVVYRSFKPQYDNIRWRNNEKEFEAWCNAKTGYPIVDAGMNELNQTGFMHNRVRMITASFLTKHLLIDWRWGEAYFAKKLLDYELASNNGSWQWVAGSGCDASPYFRIFNPITQQKKFDPASSYIKKWLPDMSNYPPPIVEHEFARKRALEVYGAVLRTL